MTNYVQETHELFAQDVANLVGLRLGAYLPTLRAYS